MYLMSRDMNLRVQLLQSVWEVLVYPERESGSPVEHGPSYGAWNRLLLSVLHRILTEPQQKSGASFHI